ncbi:MAG: tRNA (adenosine(37)-N6)-threonylcarbamoyltransferase complex dimerization subunit type 1 TsaB [Fusobacteriaceae bacterium]
MLVLGIDTSTKVGSVAIYSDEVGLLAELTINTLMTHSETIMDCINDIFKLTKKNINDINKVAVSKGPGSFTGIRIGVAVAKGLVYGSEKKIVGMNELDVIAELTGNLTDKSYKIIPMIDARKERVYYSIYSQNKKGELIREIEYRDGEISDIKEQYRGNKIIFLGDGATNYRNNFDGAEWIFYSRAKSIPRAGILAEMATKKESENLIMLEPFYISKTQAEREKILQEARNG